MKDVKLNISLITRQYITHGITCTPSYLWGVHIMKKYNWHNSYTSSVFFTIHVRWTGQIAIGRIIEQNNANLRFVVTTDHSDLDSDIPDLLNILTLKKSDHNKIRKCPDNWRLNYCGATVYGLESEENRRRDICFFLYV